MKGSKSEPFLYIKKCTIGNSLTCFQMEFLRFFSLQLATFTAVYVMIFVLISIDLFAGVRKAKRRGEFRSSTKYRKTADKLVQYYSFLLAATVIDAMQMLTIHVFNEASGYEIWKLPAVTLLCALFLAFIEVTSIWERADQKTKENAKTAVNIAEVAAATVISLAKDSKDIEGLLEKLSKLKDNKKTDEQEI